MTLVTRLSRFGKESEFFFTLINVIQSTIGGILLMFSSLGFEGTCDDDEDLS